MQNKADNSSNLNPLRNSSIEKFSKKRAQVINTVKENQAKKESNSISVNDSVEIKNRNNHQANQEFLNSMMEKSKEKTKENKENYCKKKLRINTGKCRGEIKLVKHIIEKYKWVEDMDISKCDLLWCGLPLKDEEYHYPLLTKVNRIPGMDELAHKKTTGWFLNKFQEYFPDEFDFFPRTFLLPEQMNKFLNYFEKNKKNNYLYIAKPTSGSQGDGIVLVRKPEDLPMFRNSYIQNDQYVVQRYIDNPLLIENKKFDLRLYVLVTSVNPMIVFLNEEGLARFCSEDYEKPTNKNLSNH
jgi:tubulin polyglutamylase TTLL11